MKKKKKIIEKEKEMRSMDGKKEKKSGKNVSKKNGDVSASCFQEKHRFFILMFTFFFISVRLLGFLPPASGARSNGTKEMQRRRDFEKKLKRSKVKVNEVN